MKTPLEKVADYAAAEAEARVALAAQTFGPLCESPIEIAFLTAFLTVWRDATVYDNDGEFRSTNSGTVAIRPQYQIGQYRVDFAITPFSPNSSKAWLVVECDGHDFHERTKEQAARDRAKDRDLQEHGHVIFRFTGSEIWRDPIKCAQQAAAWLMTAIVSEIEL